MKIAETNLDNISRSDAHYTKGSEKFCYEAVISYHRSIQVYEAMGLMADQRIISFG